MPAILELVDTNTLDQQPPRPLPTFFLLNLIGEYLLERPLRSYLDPVVLGGLITAATLLIFQVGPLLWLTLLALLVVRVSRGCWRICRDVYEDYRLLRYGKVLNAHILGIRSCRDTNGDLSGAYIDCAIPLSKRLSSVGSVWIPDAAEASRIAEQGRMPVIALARSPGTWRLRDGDGPQVRYAPLGE
ncbi:MAG: hypothetical protein HC822_19340 [Oscillochloris sp.]|nr:hypothetical protein [Oscillochloris sp.]